MSDVRDRISRKIFKIRVVGGIVITAGIISSLYSIYRWIERWYSFTAIIISRNCPSPPPDETEAECTYLVQYNNQFGTMKSTQNYVVGQNLTLSNIFGTLKHIPSRGFLILISLVSIFTTSLGLVMLLSPRSFIPITSIADIVGDNTAEFVLFAELLPLLT